MSEMPGTNLPTDIESPNDGVGGMPPAEEPVFAEPARKAVEAATEEANSSTSDQPEIITPKLSDEQRKQIGLRELDHFPDLEIVVKAVICGKYDDHFAAIDQALEDRRRARRDAVLAQVKEVFGDNAEVRLTDIAPLAPQPEPRQTVPGPNDNPFVQRAQQASGNSEVVTEDALSDLDSVEAGMEEPLDIERRGAIIGGMHSSDMGI